MNPHAKIIARHQQGLQRVEIPAMIGDAPACTECGKAWPCPTIDVMQSLDEIDDVFDYANYRMSQIFETFGGTMLRAAKVSREYDSKLGDHVDLLAYWHPQWERYAKNRAYSSTQYIMPLNESARTRKEVNDHLTDFVRTLEDTRTGNIPAYYTLTGADRDR